VEKGELMPDRERIAVTRRIAAPASQIFELITDPMTHVRIDGSGMLVAAPGAERLMRVGDTFEVDMDREPLGDIPLGKYKVTNAVTRIEQDRRLEWNVALTGTSPIGHVYGYLLESTDRGVTEVLSYCDWSDLAEEWRGHVVFPIVPPEMLKRSLENLARLLP
jgi:uncharacterized protein YndB with AHSA1/START domain